MRVLSNIQRFFFGFGNGLLLRVSALFVLSAALLFVQLTAPPAASAQCGDPGCTPSTCCDYECTYDCCDFDQYEWYCVDSCFICFQVCSSCCV
jgi:hypothetical protein